MSQRILKCTVCGGDHSIVHCDNKCDICHGDNQECSCSEQPPPNKKPPTEQDLSTTFQSWLTCGMRGSCCLWNSMNASTSDAVSPLTNKTCSFRSHQVYKSQWPTIKHYIQENKIKAWLYRKIHCLTSEFLVKFHEKNLVKFHAKMVFRVEFNVESTCQAVNFSWIA